MYINHFQPPSITKCALSLAEDRLTLERCGFCSRKILHVGFALILKNLPISDIERLALAFKSSQFLSLKKQTHAFLSDQQLKKNPQSNLNEQNEKTALRMAWARFPHHLYAQILNFIGIFTVYIFHLQSTYNTRSPSLCKTTYFYLSR